MIEADTEELGESDREDGEIDTGDAKAEGKEADHRPASDRQRNREQHADPRRDAELDEQRRGRVGADADIERVAKRELASEAHHDVPRLADISEVQDEDENREQVIAGETGHDQKP